MKSPPLVLEQRLWSQGKVVAGLDEAGRGAWAGPVVAAAVLLPPQPERLLAELAGVDDSKRLRPAERERLDTCIRRVAAVGVGISPATEIDAAGILPATMQSMQAAIAALPRPPDFLLIDHIPYALGDLPQQRLVRGESESLSIAAASIVAKVFRDRLMQVLDGEYPGYGFGQHKGYGTPAHRQALDRLGPSLVHRCTWAPLIQLRLPACRGDRPVAPTGRSPLRPGA